MPDSGMQAKQAKPEMLKTDDLKRRCYALRNAVTKRGMGKSGLMHTAARMLGTVGEILDHAQDVDGSESAALARWVSDQHQELKIENEQLRERLAEIEKRS